MPLPEYTFKNAPINEDIISKNSSESQVANTIEVIDIVSLYIANRIIPYFKEKKEDNLELILSDEFNDNIKQVQIEKDGQEIMSQMIEDMQVQKNIFSCMTNCFSTSDFESKFQQLYGDKKNRINN